MSVGSADGGIPKAIANGLIWDSRAPYATYLRSHQHLNGFFRVTRCAYALGRDAANGRSADEPVERLMPDRPRRRRDGPSFDFAALKRCDCHTIGAFASRFDELEDTLHRSILVMEVSLFESYVVCWAANMLLTAAETGHLGQIPSLGAIVDRLLDKGRLPEAGGVVALLQSFPDAKRRLRTEAPRKLDEEMTRVRPLPRKGGDVLTLMEAWRILRNHVVHGDAPVTAALARNLAPIWDELHDRNYDGLPRLTVGTRLCLTPNLAVAALSVFGVFARVLWTHLLKYSAEKRGHANAPGPFLGPRRPEDMPSDPPLLLPGEERLVTQIRQAAAADRRSTRDTRDLRRRAART